MAYVAVCLAAFTASGLTLFSGFGLGTLLMPVVAIFFPLDAAIAMTAVVHLANNVFKLALMGRRADRPTVAAFGVPAVVAALAGAQLLNWLGSVPALATTSLAGLTLELSPLKVTIGGLIAMFLVLEWSDRFAAIALDRKWLPAGGLISGFFGGLSGHQGAFRSMFLLRAGLDKDAFVATGIVLAVMVDLSRLLVYGAGGSIAASLVDWRLAGAACAAAFLGAWAGASILGRVTIRVVRLGVSVLLAVVALGLLTGLL